MTATISFNVDPLTDNAVWFANAAAWNNYWASVNATVDIDPLTTTLYTQSAYDTGLSSGMPIFNIAGEDYILVTKPCFDSLLAMVNALNASYMLLRTEFYNQGFITNAQ